MPAKHTLLEDNLARALRIASSFIEDVSDDTPGRTDRFFEAREAWRAALQAYDESRPPRPMQEDETTVKISGYVADGSLTQTVSFGEDGQPVLSRRMPWIGEMPTDVSLGVFAGRLGVLEVFRDGRETGNDERETHDLHSADWFSYLGALNTSGDLAKVLIDVAEGDGFLRALAMRAPEAVRVMMPVEGEVGLEAWIISPLERHATALSEPVVWSHLELLDERVLDGREPELFHVEHYRDGSLCASHPLDPGFWWNNTSNEDLPVSAEVNELISKLAINVLGTGTRMAIPDAIDEIEDACAPYQGFYPS